MPITPNGSRSNLPRLVFMARLPCGSGSSRKKSCALRMQNSVASRTTRTSVVSASTAGLPASRQIRSAIWSRCSLRSRWNRRSTATLSRTGVASHTGCACLARWTAVCTWLGLAHANSASTSPVAGLVLTIVLFPTTVASVAIVLNRFLYRCRVEHAFSQAAKNPHKPIPNPL